MPSRDVISSTLRYRMASLACALAVGLVALMPFQASAEQEVIAVEDITAAADCQVTVETYRDAARTQTIEKQTYPCRPGSVFHAERMSRSRAVALGRRYLVSSGDPRVDRQAVRELKRRLYPDAGTIPSRGRPERAEQGAGGMVGAADCGPVYYYTQWLSYWAEGGRVRTGVYYHDDSSGYYGCSVVLATQSTTYLTEPLWAGEDLFWDEQYWQGGITQGSHEMNCRQFSAYAMNHYYSPTAWQGYRGYLFEDEAINDTSLGCDWWGEEYVGSMILG